MYKRNLVLGICAVLAATVAGCGNVKERVQTEGLKEESRDIFAMDTYMTVTAYGSEAAKAVEMAEEEIKRLDGLLSTGDTGSEVYRINKDKVGTMSADTKCLIERALELYDSTGGVFDIAVYPVMEAWGFTDQNYKVPSPEVIEELLDHVDASGIEFDEENSRISLEEGMQIDLGGIAKGYTSARIMDIFRECGIASGLVNLGGNVQVIGSKPDGSLWRVAVKDPEDPGGYVGILSVKDRAVITSGAYERYFEQDGTVYHHIIDPHTGYPADSGLVSVTIVSADGTLADGLSTSLFIMGLDRAGEYWREHKDEFEAVLMTEKGELYVTEGLKDSFTSDYEVRVIEE